MDAEFYPVNAFNCFCGQPATQVTKLVMGPNPKRTTVQSYPRCDKHETTFGAVRRAAV